MSRYISLIFRIIAVARPALLLDRKFAIPWRSNHLAAGDGALGKGQRRRAPDRRG